MSPCRTKSSILKWRLGQLSRPAATLYLRPRGRDASGLRLVRRLWRRLRWLWRLRRRNDGVDDGSASTGWSYKSAMDDPNRIAKSKAAGALFGLTPKKYQSGEKDVTGGITRTGDEMARTALYEVANVLLARITRFSKLKRWGMDVAKRRGSKRAKVALARKIAVILHRMWVDGTTYRWTNAQPIAVQV